MFEKFPKTRSELPEEYQKIYFEQYKNDREGKTSASYLSQKMEAWLHRKIAADVKGINNKSTLEIGAGTLNQLKFENCRPYDIVEPFTGLYIDSKFINRVDEKYSDINEISYKKKYDRIISTATFEHITDLPKVVAKTCFLLNKNGKLRVSIPNEGSFIWKVGWKLTTGLEYRIKYGLNYEVLMKHEHVNTATEVEQVLKYFYRTTKCTCFGINKTLALYRFYECSVPQIELAEEYLATTK
jgi:hypothetical protein